MKVGVDYLAELFETHEDVGKVLLLYNGAGTKKIKRYDETGKWTNYCELILAKSARLERQRGK
jgi:hypothetical protein